MQQLGAELRQLLRQLRAAPQGGRATLQLHLRERLEMGRLLLLGRHSHLPASLRHYAVSLTEVQWLLDAWIAGGDDEAQLRRDFFHAASRLFDDEEAESEARARTPWWTRWREALLRLWPAGRAAGSGLAERRVPGADRPA